MTTFLIIITCLGTFWGGYTVYINITEIKQRLIFSACTLMIVFGVYELSIENEELKRIQSIERQALLLDKNRDFNFVDRGFVMATLAFLEKNKKDFPDTYQRAQELCDLHNCLSPDSRHTLTDLAFTFSGMLRGIAKINSTGEENG